jgi:hypothetical protein
LRVEQKLAYLYGWKSFLNAEDEVDDETVAMLVLLMGVMLNVGAAANTITKFAATTAEAAVSKKVASMTLTKTAFYNPLKRVLRVIGINLTKKSFGDTVGKVVPLLGGAVSGGMTYATFKPGSEKLRQYLRALPISGIDTSVPEEIPPSYLSELASQAKGAADTAAVAATKAAKMAGESLAGGAEAVGMSIGHGAEIVGKAALEGAQSAGSLATQGPQAAAPVIAEGINGMGSAITSGAASLGGMLGNFAKKHSRGAASEKSDAQGEE